MKVLFNHPVRARHKQSHNGVLCVSLFWQAPSHAFAHMFPTSSCTRLSRCSLNNTRILLRWLHTIIHLHSHLCNQWIARCVSAFSTKVRKQREEFKLARGFRSWMTVISLSGLYVDARADCSCSTADLLRSEVSFRSTGSLFYRTGHPWAWQTPTKAITERYAFIPTMAVDGKLTDCVIYYVQQTILHTVATCERWSVYLHGGVTVYRQNLWLLMFTVLY